MINLDKVCEGIHYTIIDVADGDPSQVWLVRILEGEFKDIVMRIDEVRIDGKHGTLQYRVDSMKDNKEIDQTEQLLDFSGDIIEDILRTQISNGSMVIDGQDSGE